MIILQQYADRFREAGRIIFNQDVATMLHIETLSAHYGRDGGLAGCHRLIDLDAGASPHPQRYDKHLRLAQMLDDRGNCSGDLNRVASQSLNPGVRITSNNAEARFGDTGNYEGP